MSAVLVVGWVLAVAAASLLLIERRTAHRSTERVVRACHELRGPLTNVMLALDDTEHRPTTGDDVSGSAAEQEDRRLLLAAVTLELARARRAVEELGAASLRHGTRDEARPVALDGLVRDLVAIHDVAARARGREVLVVGTASHATVVGDRARLAQAIGNLIQNAIEHGAGTVRVRVTEAAGRAQVHVCDEGHGLRVPIDRLLHEARRGQRGRGMRIVTDALRAHGGALRSAPAARGARLVAELPLAPGVSSAVAR